MKIKKILFAVLVVLAASKAGFAFDFDGRIWRSSITRSNDPQVLIASMPVILRAVVVEYAGTGSIIDICDGQTSTNTATKCHRIDTTAKGQYNYHLGLSSGMVYGTNGTSPAGVTILWDWSYGIPKGKEAVGR